MWADTGWVVLEWVELGLEWVWPGWVALGWVRPLGLAELGSGEQWPG